MVKKTYFKASVSSLLLQAVILAGLALDIFFLIFFAIGLTKVKENSDLATGIVLTVIFGLGLFIIGYLESNFLVGNIVLEEKRIYCSGDNRFGRDKIQYKASVEYKDIKKIEIVPLRKRSNGTNKTLMRPIPFLSIETKKGKRVLFGLHFMSSKAVGNMINNLMARCEQVDNKIEADPIKLLEDFKKARLAIEE